MCRVVAAWPGLAPHRTLTETSAGAHSDRLGPASKVLKLVLVRARVQQAKAKVGNLWAKAGAQVAKDAAASKHRVERNNASKAARAKFQKAGPF